MVSIAVKRCVFDEGWQLHLKVIPTSWPVFNDMLPLSFHTTCCLKDSLCTDSMDLFNIYTFFFLLQFNGKGILFLWFRTLLDSLQPWFWVWFLLSLSSVLHWYSVTAGSVWMHRIVVVVVYFVLYFKQPRLSQNSLCRSGWSQVLEIHLPLPPRAGSCVPPCPVFRFFFFFLLSDICLIFFPAGWLFSFLWSPVCLHLFLC